MVEKPNKSTKGLSISLIPRKIMLEKQSKEKGNLELTSMNVPQNGVVPLSGKIEKKTNQTRREDQTQICLLHTIANYLKENGFSKTLYAFLSEAQLEVDSWKAYSFDLEDLICKHLETRLTESADLQIDHLAGRNKEESNHDVSRKSSLSKKRKKSSGSATNTETESDRLEVENENFDLIPDPSHNMGKSLRESAEHVIGPTKILLNNESVDMNLKSKGKKKKRKAVSENTANSNELETSVDLDRIGGKKVKSDAEITNHEILSGLSPIKSEVKKNKKDKLISDPLTENNEQADKETNQEDNHEILSVASPLKSKEKKYKKNKLISDPHAENIEQANPVTNQELVKEESKGLDFLQGAKKSDIQQLESVPEAKNLLDGAHAKSKEKKKKHKSSSKGLDNEIVAEIGQGAIQDGDKHISKDLEAAGAFNEIGSPLKTVSKKIKSDADDNDREGGSQVKSKGKKNKKHKLISEENEEVEGQIHQSKRRKVEDHTKIKECLDQFAKEGSTEKATEPRNAAMAKQPEEKKKEGSASTKTVKKEDTRSEPKTVNAFRRVNIDEVEFANEKLQDNSYWAKSGADSGYGAKAQGILGQVRGKDFRHEKTKKKRGSYRGGQIDLQSHSIKFNDSDEE